MSGVDECLNVQFARGGAYPARPAPRKLERMRGAGQRSSRHGDGRIGEARMEVGEVEVRGAVGKIGGDMRAAVEQDTQMRTPAHMRLTAVGGSERRAGDRKSTRLNSSH